MADLPEVDQWDDAIYQLEITDAVLGGVDGPDNIQAKQLANRTLYLKNLIENINTAEAVVAHVAANDPHSQYLLGTDFTGTVSAFAMTAVPAGWIECNGATLSRTTYADLFAKIGTTYGAGDGSTTFHLPDLRGEFIRGWDHGRGVDAGRAIGSSQTDDLKSHSHTLTASSTIEGTSSDIDRNDGIGSSTSRPRSISTNATGGSETRPRNIALMICIKY
ncbi:MAG: phage tail protein [Candidatus Sedimenticola sp. (ex Thyasira tokunagai)]